MLTSTQLRHECYAQAALTIANVEQQLLPTYGGRSWQVTCKMTEPKNANVLFRTYKGHMELAVLPHLLEKIPARPTWAGYRGRKEEEEWEDMEPRDEDQHDTAARRLLSREVSTLSTVAWNYKHKYAVPAITLKWSSPDHMTFHSRKAAWEYAEELARRQVFLNKHLLGIGASGKLLQPFVPCCFLPQDP